MKPYRKKFDPSLHAANDERAKKAIARLFSTLDPYYVEESKKRTAVDFVLFNGDKHVGYVEVEIKRVWKGSTFTYSDVNFPERKWKYCNLDKPTIFIMFNESCSDYLCVDGKTMLTCPLEVVRNKYVGYGEQFFKVPLEKASFNDVMAVIERLEL